MIRFIDITNDYWDDSVSRKTKVFSFIDTVNDKFLTINSCQTWGYVRDLKMDLASDFNLSEDFIKRVLELVPKGYE